MIDDNIREYLLAEQLNAAVRAGAEIMRIYNGSDDYDISLKSDHTPITIADRMAHDSIKRSLGATRIPILSEEGRSMLYEERCNWELFWLVDPLDGTVEFIKGNNEFTVNIALMENNICISAIVYVPYYNKMYIYDLLMERDANSAMLDLSASSSASAEREINGASDLYESNMLVGYYARKKALVEYELGIANTLSLTTSRDSLKIVAAELKNRDYRLSRLSLPRRSFIPCEPVEIKGTTFYHTKNPIPHTKVYDYGTVYRVRIGLFKNRPNLTALKGVTPLSYTDAYNNGLYAYFVGTFPTEQGAQEAAAKLRNLGFKSPVVAVWVDGEYYPTVEDMRRTQNNYNLEISGISTLSEDIKAKILTHKADCTISRVGTSFVVGTFEGKSVVEAVAADLRAMGGGIEVTIVKKP